MFRKIKLIDLLKVSCGVPQGFVLVPKLFIFYISDTCRVPIALKLSPFAEDILYIWMKV